MSWMTSKELWTNEIRQEYGIFNTKSKTHSTDAPDAGIAAADAADNGHDRAAVSD